MIKQAFEAGLSESNHRVEPYDRFMSFDSVFRQGILFVVTLNQAFNASSGVYNTFPKEKLVSNRYNVQLYYYRYYYP
jgi:hypothetical protein